MSDKQYIYSGSLLSHLVWLLQMLIVHHMLSHFSVKFNLCVKR